MKKVLFVVYGGGHVNIAIPLIKELGKDSKFKTLVLGLSIAMNTLRQEGIPHFSIADFEDVIMDKDSWRYGKMLAEKWHVDGKGISRRETEIYFGVSMRDLVREVGEEEAFHRLEETGKNAFYPVYTLQKIINQIKPDLIVTTNVPRMERAAVRTGLNTGIPTLAIHDYLAFEKRHKLEADRIAVMCDITMENLVKTGHDPEKLVITGQPVFDQIPRELKEFSDEVLREKWKLPKDRRFILLGTQPNPTSRLMLETTLEAVSQLDGYDLVVKPHPGEDSRSHEKWIDGKDRVYLRPAAPIRELIFCSDLTITIFSTVGFESVLMDKPLIQFNLTGEPNPVPLFNYGVSLSVEKKEDLLLGIKKCLFNTEIQKSFEVNRVKHFNHILHGSGTENIIKLIHNMVGS